MNFRAVAQRARQITLADEIEPTKALDKAIDEIIEANPDILGSEIQLRRSASDTLFAFGALQQFLDDDSIEEIWINEPNRIFTAINGVPRSHAVELSAEELHAIVERMLRSTGRRLDRSAPFVDASLPDGSRLHVVIPEITRQHWSVNIRKFPQKILTLDDLQKLGSITREQSDYLSSAIQAGKNILVSGATQAGKTTVLCALLGESSASDRVVSVEETFEIRTKLADWVALQTRQSNLEGKGEVTLRRLVKEALRMRPSRLVVGEVREAESLDLLIALNSGIPGLCTIHANSAVDAISKLCTLPLLAGSNISSDFVRPTVASCIDLVVHCEMSTSGTRRVREICTVNWNESEQRIQVQEVENALV